MQRSSLSRVLVVLPNTPSDFADNAMGFVHVQSVFSPLFCCQDQGSPWAETGEDAAFPRTVQ